MARSSDERRCPAPTVRDRLRQPHILAEMLKLTLAQSSDAQKQFLDALEALAEGIREMLDGEGLIRSVAIDHTSLWSEVAGKPISFIDGGMANAKSLGAEPVAVRVGSYTVTPGVEGEDRERFRMLKQLVAELFDMSGLDALFDDYFHDPSKLRDAARVSLELSAAVESLKQTPCPEYLFLHGALVNPVSAYADKDFPPFSTRGLEIIMPGSGATRTGRDRDFVSVYLALLNQLQESGVNVISVVERASPSMLVSTTLLGQLKGTSMSPGSSVIEKAVLKIRDLRIPDAVLFHAILNEGEYIVPIGVDRNVPEKRPRHSAHIIDEYPVPKVLYVGAGQFAQPLRVEFFDNPPAGYEACVRLVVHSCRLMPRYAFPVGLDIVDKYAKVPEWMNRPIHVSMAVQLMKRALDTGNPKMIESAKRFICGTRRDWLFRPDFNS